MADKKIQCFPLFLYINQVLVYIMFDSLASFCVSITATSLLAVQMPLNNRPTSSRVWKPAKWKLSKMFGVCERLALAAEALAGTGRQVWRRLRLNDMPRVTFIRMAWTVSASLTL